MWGRVGMSDVLSGGAGSRWGVVSSGGHEEGSWETDDWQPSGGGRGGGGAGQQRAFFLVSVDEWMSHCITGGGGEGGRSKGTTVGVLEWWREKESS